MVEPKAIIRAFEPGDEKSVKFTLGLAAMEGLAVANKRTTFHPLTISVWIGVSCIMIQLLNWWPVPEYGWLGWLLPLPAFGCWGVPILFAIDWVNRPDFEDVATNIMRRPDFADLQKYYTRSPASGLFIIEYGSKFVGLIAVDASIDSQSEQPFVKKNEEGRDVLADMTKNFYSKGTSSVATIRHFFIEEPYRKSGVQQDILAFATRHVFTTNRDIQVLKASATPLLDYKYAALCQSGFAVEKEVGKLGILKWRLEAMSLERERWERGQSKESSDI